MASIIKIGLIAAAAGAFVWGVTNGGGTKNYNMPASPQIQEQPRPSDDVETLRRGMQQLETALKDPSKVSLMECMGVKVFSDPQPAGHPPSAKECERLLENASRSR